MSAFTILLLPEPDGSILCARSQQRQQPRSLPGSEVGVESEGLSHWYEKLHSNENSTDFIQTKGN